MKVFRKSILLLTLFIGIFLFLISIPITIEMVKEKLYEREMERNYKITELNEMYKGAPTDYQFGNSKIDVYRVLQDDQPYEDPWNNLVISANIYITVDSLTQAVLKDYPVKIGKEGLNQYTHYLSYWTVLDKRTNEETFVITLQMNGAKEIELPNGDREGYVSADETEYLLLTIQKDGKVTKDAFTYKNKSKLQTQLIPPMYSGKAGYYSDVWKGYPVFFFPIYPFLTLILGIVFIYIVIRKSSLCSKEETEQPTKG